MELTPVLGHDELLAAGELVLRAAESLDGVSQVSITGTDADQDLSDLDSCNCSVGLAKSASHASLKSIGAGT